MKSQRQRALKEKFENVKQKKFQKRNFFGKKIWKKWIYEGNGYYEQTFYFFLFIVVIVLVNYVQGFG